MMNLYGINKYQANKIKIWREVEGCSWRRIADKAATEWPEMEIIPGHQIEGRELCLAAQHRLNEYWEEKF